MDKRFFLAIALSVTVLVLSELLFPSAARRRAVGVGGDSAVTRVPSDSTTNAPPAPPPASTAAAQVPARPVAPSVAEQDAQTTTITERDVTYRFTNVGAKLLEVTLSAHQSRLHPGEPVMLATPGRSLVGYRLLINTDTVPLADVLFQAERASAAGAPETLRYRARVAGGEVMVSYTFSPDSYVARVHGVVSTPGARALLIDLPEGFRSEEADTVDDQRHLAYAYKPIGDGAASIAFGKLNPGEPPRVDARKLTWVAAKDKYFLVAVLAPTDSQAFAGLVAVAQPRVSKIATRASATVWQPLSAGGVFDFDLYTGPQEWRRLLAMGRDFEHVNPYGGFLRGVVQPFATLVIRILLWLHETLRLNYGWVLIIFGVGVRVLLWPLYQSSMRTSLRMQRIQPQIQEAQARNKNNPEKQRDEMMRIYAEHGMTPLSPLMGCLPAMLPMPILFALFFVFQNTIEFRGVSFLWLPDIALKDPLYVLPLIMGASMFALSWIGMRNAPPNPQGKVLQYVLPVMMTVLFLNFASGLNLYYAVQNLAAFPQQWLIAAERAKVMPGTAVGRPSSA